MEICSTWWSETLCSSDGSVWITKPQCPSKQTNFGVCCVILECKLSLCVSLQEVAKLTAKLMDDLRLILPLSSSSFLLLWPSPFLWFSSSTACMTQASPGSAWTGASLGGRAQKQSSTLTAIRIPAHPLPGLLSFRESALCWAEAVNKLLMRKQTSVLR